ncbi:MAG: hypothetical protein SPD11_09725 [Sphaerochaetaceae bacterium]|nr:hypothetical protein [Sphaerochaetaceae bacterium]
MHSEMHPAEECILPYEGTLVFAEILIYDRTLMADTQIDHKNITHSIVRHMRIGAKAGLSLLLPAW